MYSLLRHSRTTTTTRTLKLISTAILSLSNTNHHSLPPSTSTTTNSHHQIPRRCKWDVAGGGCGGGVGGGGGSCGGSDYDNIRADVNCPRCCRQMPVIFSNRPLSLSGREPGIYQALNVCPHCRTAFYFRPSKLEPLQGSFIELGRLKSRVTLQNSITSGHDSKHCKEEAGQEGVREHGHEEEEEEEEGTEGPFVGPGRNRLPTPKEICRRVDQFVIGQDRAKKVVRIYSSVAKCS